MGNLGWDPLSSMVRSKCNPSGKSQAWSALGREAGGLWDTQVPQVAPGKGGRGTHLWDHLGAEGRKESRVHSSPTLSHHFHKCRKWHGKGNNPLSFAFPADAKEPFGHGPFNL